MEKEKQTQNASGKENQFDDLLALMGEIKKTVASSDQTVMDDYLNRIESHLEKYHPYILKDKDEHSRLEILTKCYEALTAEALLEEVPKCVEENGLTKNFKQNYARWLPVAKFMYLIENNGIPEEHATKLAVMFQKEVHALTYLKKFISTHPGLSDVFHDACLFVYPESGFDLNVWRKLAYLGDNLLDKSFRRLLPQASVIEALIKKAKLDHEAVNKPEASVPTLENAKKQAALATEIVNTIIKISNDIKKINDHPEKSRRDKTQEIMRLNEDREGKIQSLTTMGLSFDENLHLETLKAFHEQYKNQAGSNLAKKIFLDNGLTEKDYERFEKLERKDNDIEIPNIKIDGASLGFPGIYLMKVPVLDKAQAARAACIGKLTDCCQSLSGEAGEPCAIHGLTSEHGGFYVVCKGDINNPKVEDPLFGASWVWRSKTGALVLDSIESSHTLEADGSTKQLIGESSIKLFRELSKDMVEQGYADKVSCGASSGISEWVGLKVASCISEEPKDYRGYRDSNEQLFLYDKANPYYTADLHSESKKRHDAIMKKIFSGSLISEDKEGRFNSEYWGGVAYAVNAVRYFKGIGGDKQFISEIEGYFDEDGSSEKKANVNKFLVLLAKESGNIEVFDYVINRAADLNVVDLFGNTAIHTLVRSPDRDLAQEIVRKLIDHGARVDIKNRSDRTAIEEAAYYKNASVLGCVIDKDNVNTGFKCRYGATGILYIATALHIAIETNNTGLFNKLIEMGAKTDIKNRFGKNALECAASSYNLAMLTPLVNEENVNTVFEGLYGATTALHVAIEKNNIELFNKSIQLGAKTDIKDWQGRTAFECAFYYKNAVMLTPLVNEENVNTVFKGEVGATTALHIAIEKNNVELFNKLIQLGAKTDIEDWLRRTALECALYYALYYDAMLTPLVNKENVNTLLNTTALHIAIEKNNVELFDKLIQLGAKTDIKDRQGRTALHNASVRSDFEKLAVLIKKGADIDAKDSRGFTALYEAVYTKNIEAFKYLLEQGADVNVQNNEGYTALHIVSDLNESSSLDAVNLLLEHGANLSIKNTSGETALDCARRKNNSEVARVLEEHERKGLHNAKAFTPMKDNPMNVSEIDSKDPALIQASDRMPRGPGQL